MNQDHVIQTRVLAVAPSSRGIGFAIMESPERLVDWGVKSSSGDKNKNAITALAQMIERSQPSLIVLEEVPSCPARTQDLRKQIIALAKTRRIKARVFSRREVRSAFFAEGPGTKHALAEILAERFPQEIGFELPPKRSLLVAESRRMGIFDAVALALMPWQSGE